MQSVCLFSAPKEAQICSVVVRAPGRNARFYTFVNLHVISVKGDPRKYHVYS